MNLEQNNPFDDDEATFYVLINNQQHTWRYGMGG